MVVDERARHELFGRLEDTLGAEHAVTLMEHLPPVGWADLATKHGLAVLRQELGSEITSVRRDLTAVEERLNLRIDGVRQELGSEIGAVGKEMAAVKQEVIALLRAEISSALTAQTKTLMFIVLGALTSMGALVFAAARV